MISDEALGTVVVVEVAAEDVVGDDGGVLPATDVTGGSDAAGGTAEEPPLVPGAADVAGPDVGRVIGRASLLLEHATSSIAAPRPTTTCLTLTRPSVANPTAAVSQTPGDRVARDQDS